MRSQKKYVRIATAALSLLMSVSTFAMPVFAATRDSVQATKHYAITSPYADVDWAGYNQYKANFHAHSTNSDGGNLTSAMVEDHYKKGFDILAMTDHDYLTTSWDKVAKGAMTTARIDELAQGAGRDGKGMIPLHNTDEQSVTDHINSFFAEFNNKSGATMKSTIKAVQDAGGITHINHPGRYTGGSNSNLTTGAAASNNPANVKKYVDLFREFDSCVGMEIINKIDNESRSDRILWDNILKEMMPEGRFVWGFSNDDTHSLNATGYSWNEMLMPTLTEADTRTAMETGAFYAVSRVDRREGINDKLPNGSAMVTDGTSASLYLLEQSTPSISNIVVNEKNGTITITGADYDTIEWIADGQKIATGETLKISDYSDKIGSYVRAQLKSSTGIAFTQPFGVKTANLLNVETDAHLVKKGEYFHVKSYFDETVNSNAAILEYTFDTSKFDYRGFTPSEGMTVLGDIVVTDNGIKLTVMIEDYNAKNLGEVLMSAKEDMDLENKDNVIELSLQYVIKDENEAKEVYTAKADTTFTSTSGKPGTGENGEVTLIDLSNIIDVFGMTSEHADWSKYRFFDYNNNGKIDIQDISTLAKLIK